MDKYKYFRKTKEPYKTLKVSSSEYDGSKVAQENKKYWRQQFSTLSNTKKDSMKEKEINLLSEILPNELYEKVCNILHIDKTSRDLKKVKKSEVINTKTLVKELLLSRRQTINIHRDLESDTEVEFISSDEEAETSNVHYDFLKKPARQQITWCTHYLGPEKDSEKSLVKKADDITDKITHNFCDYMKQLGGDQQSQLFTPKTIKELFQVEFNDHVAKSLQVVSKEMPTVEDRIATVTGNPEKSQYATLTREIAKDIRAEKQSDKLCAFHRSLPSKQQWRTPRNDTKNWWRSARYVPQDLVTLKTVWEGITNLRSVKEYCRWMINHPEYRRPPYLRSLGMFDDAVLNARLTFELQQQPSPIISPTDFPAPIDHIRRRLSEFADVCENL